jgi:predicted MPP superfamily phosphohydrolase
MDKNNSKHNKLPGTIGNPFDLFLRFTEKIQQWPEALVFVILCGLAYLAALGQVTIALILLAFLLTDWILLGLLPKVRISFGPAKPPVLMLGAMRAMIALITFQISFDLGITLQIIGSCLVIYGFWIEPQKLKITHQMLTIDHLDQPLKIVHLGDLHIERMTRREEKVLLAIEQFQPDLILFSGDFLNLSYLRDLNAQKEARAFLSALHANFGVYAVSGSPAVDLPEILPDLLKGLDLHRLDDEVVLIPYGLKTLQIIGITCTHDPVKDGETLMRLSEGLSGDVTILLYHTPDLAPHSADLPIDLQLSGHTHGGQIRLPFYGAIFTGALTGKRFESGFYQVKNLHLYVTNGIGLEGAGAPRVRFLCRPEIIFWEIC